MAKKLKIGVFGAGRGIVAIRQLLNHPDAELTAVCDLFEPQIERCRNEAEAAGMKIAYYADFEDFFNHDMDAVILANRANEHVPYGIRLMESGRHIMSECLTCANMQQAVQLIEAVERTGMVYAYAENYCYTPARWEMRRRYRNGDIGELMYAEGEYVHDCSPIWAHITRGERNHWRNLMPSTFYCTHSIGPILKMTGLRPVQVSAFETPNMPFMRKLGTASGTLGMEIITRENGAIMKSLHFGMKHAVHTSNYQLNGDKGALKDMGNGNVAAYIEGDKGNGKGDYELYDPETVIAEAKNSGHGGADFYPTHYFIRSILGDETAMERSINVYDAVDMCIPGTLGYRSIVNGNVPIKVPNLRNKDEREAYRNDTFCTFPDIAGDQYVSNNIHNSDPIPDEVFEDVHRRWLAGEGKDL